MYYNSNSGITFWDKKKICDIVTKGLTHYDNNGKTKVITDWSKQGKDFVVMQ